MAKIYISSTFEDLKDCRHAVYDALRKMRHDVMAMEDDVATDQRPLHKCLSDVAACDVYVGILAWRYGYVPRTDNPAKKSITELEFRHAITHHKPCLIFLLHEDAPWPPAKMEKGRRAKKLAVLRAELSEEYIASFFQTADELALLVSVAVTNLVQKTPELSSRRNATGLGLPVNVPDLPAHFLPRPEDLQALKHAVLASVNKSVALTGVGRVGVHGMGGIGKSVLAAALARDEEVQRIFPDGVLWLTLGQTPVLSLLQAQLATMLGDTSQAFEDLQRGKAQLSKLLADKACLLIVDDLWDVAHAAAFDVLGPRCKLLLTTRDASLITALGAEEHRLDVLSDTQAQSLLAQWTNQTVHTLPVVAFNVMRECGNLPLALAVSAALVRDGTSWTDVLEALRQADLAFLNHPHGSIMKSIKVSVEALPPAEAQHYLDLAVFPIDEAVPEAAVVRLWCEAHSTAGRNERHARHLLIRLERKALLHLDGSEPHRTMSLHDLQYDYIHATHDNLPALHTKLVEAYRSQCPNGWASGPNDGYFFQHLVHHLTQANRYEDVRPLLLEFDWLRAKLTATNVNALLADYDVLADDPIICLVQGTLRLSAHELARDPNQLAGQLRGRLLSQPTLTLPGGPLRRRLTGHTEGVSAVAVSPDGRQLISASWDRTLKVWDLVTGEEQRRLTGHTAWVSAVAMSPDGRQLISASGDRTLKVWDLVTGEEQRRLTGYTGGVSAVAVSPDGRQLISASDDETLKMWDLVMGEEQRTLTGHTAWVSAVAVSPDGRQLFSASGDRTLKVWDLVTGEEQRTLTGHTRGVNAVAVSPDGRQLFSASDDETLKVWDLVTGEEQRTLTGHTRRVNAVAVSPDGRQLFSASDDETLKVWDLVTGEEQRTLIGHTEGVNAVAVSPDGRQLISASSDKTLKVWDLVKGVLITSLSAAAALSACAIAPDGVTIAAGDTAGRVYFLRLAGVKRE